MEKVYTMGQKYNLTFPLPLLNPPHIIATSLTFLFSTTWVMTGETVLYFACVRRRWAPGDRCHLLSIMCDSYICTFTGGMKGEVRGIMAWRRAAWDGERHCHVWYRGIVTRIIVWDVTKQSGSGEGDWGGFGSAAWETVLDLCLQYMTWVSVQCSTV